MTSIVKNTLLCIKYLIENKTVIPVIPEITDVFVLHTFLIFYTLFIIKIVKN